MACIHYVRDRGWHPMAIVLRLFNGAGVATPWFRILASFKNRPSLKGLLRHEVVHIRQMQRDGWFTFWTQYFWWTLTKGYAANPYEVEAYRVSHPVDRYILMLRRWV